MKLRVILAAALLLAFTTGLSAQATEDYKKLLDELTQKRASVSPPEFMGLAQEGLAYFISKYPDSPEAVDAHLNLGQLFAQMGQAEKTVSHLESYMARSDGRKPEEVAIAKFFLAKGYIMLDQLDKAEPPLREVANGSGSIPERIRNAAAMDLARIPVLRKLVIGSPAIAIKAATSDGKEITLDTYRGKVLLLDFWASWCSPCRQEMPNVKKTYNEFHSNGFEILGVSLDDSRAKFRSYIDEQEIPWPQIFDGKGWNSEVGKLYAVNSIPATFLLDRSGKIRYRDLRGNDLYEAVKSLIAEE
jgi:peroxiredoxin